MTEISDSETPGMGSMFDLIYSEQDKAQFSYILNMSHRAEF